jgi:glucosamine 6-phosphate synthetase-like amidotransferase/phosphosugar isomerase protein
MCGIFGYVNYGDKAGGTDLLQLFNALAEVSVVRGPHASGIAYVQGGRVMTAKQPGPFGQHIYQIPQTAPVLMGHTRYSFTENYADNQNNHPFSGQTLDGQDYVLMHNGILADLANLRANARLPKPDIQTDSYIAVQLLNQAAQLNIANLHKVLQTLQGSYAFSILDANNNLFLSRGDVPVFLLHVKPWQLYIYISTRDLFEAALELPALAGGELAALYVDNNIDLAISQLELIPIEKGSSVVIDSAGNLSRGGFTFNEERALAHNWFLHCVSINPQLKQQLENLNND